VIGKLAKAVALGRVARMGPVGVLLAVYGVWRQLAPEDRRRVLGHAGSLLQRARARVADRTRTSRATRS
jgi:hypothetical protein